MKRLAPLQPNDSIRVLSLAGGGIYGLASAIWLRQLCEQVPSFLNSASNNHEYLHLFSGTSAGAINTLLLASQEDPREFVLSRGLERFWYEPGIYTNRDDPVAGAMSWLGLTAWNGQKDFLRTLRKYFQDREIQDLCHHVVIPVMQWSAKGGEAGGGWSPKIFTSLESESSEDRRVPLARLAYYASAPPGYRPIIDGYGDGGAFVPDPALLAATTACNQIRVNTHIEDTSLIRAFNYLCVDGMRWLTDCLTQSTSGRDDDHIRQYLLFANNLRGVTAEHELSTIEGHEIAQIFQAHDNKTPFTLSPQSIHRLGELLSKELAPGMLRASLLDTINSPENLRSNILVIIKYCLYAIPFAFSKGSIRVWLNTEGVITSPISQFIEAALELIEHDSSDRAEYDDWHTRTLTLLVLCLGGIAPIVHQVNRNYYPVLNKIHVLSIGVGTQNGNYWLKNFDFGLLPFSSLPSNPVAGNFYPPGMQIFLDAPAMESMDQAEALFENRFHRLNPMLFGPPSSPPALIAMCMARFDLWRRWIIRKIYDGCESGASNEAVDSAARFLTGEWRS